jgi:hypothetical protein
MSWWTKAQVIAWFGIAKMFSAVGAGCYWAQRAAAKRAAALIPGAPTVPPQP